MARGRFDRNEIQDRDGNWLYIEREEKSKKGGNIFLAIQQYGFGNGTYSIYWRKTRNVVRYGGWNYNMDCIKTRIAGREEANAEFELALETFDPGPNATKRNKRSEVTDSQRKRVYSWERSLFTSGVGKDKHPLNKRLNKDEIKDLFKMVLDHYDIPENERPKLKFRSCYGKSSFNYGWGRNFIRLSRSHYQAWVIVHELSHFLSRRAYGGYDKIAGHGPEFVGYYIDVLVEVGGQDLKTLLKSCRDYEYKTRKRTMRGIKYTLPTEIHMNKLKEAA